MAISPMLCACLAMDPFRSTLKVISIGFLMHRLSKPERADGSENGDNHRAPEYDHDGIG